jgi:hypothetical protein
MPLVELTAIDRYRFWKRTEELGQMKRAVRSSESPAIHHGTDVVATIALDKHIAGIGKQGIQIRHTQGIDACFVQYLALTESLVKIAQCSVAMFWPCLPDTRSL